MLPARGRPTQPPLLWARRTFNFWPLLPGGVSE
jgi:hypothetical protein